MAWLVASSIAVASLALFLPGAVCAVLQREVGVVSFGDPRHAWNQFVAEHYAPSLAICASKARLDERTIRCGLDVDPALDVTIPVYPEASLTPSPPDQNAGPEAEG